MASPGAGYPRCIADEDNTPSPESTNDLLRDVLERLDELGARMRNVEELVTKARFEADMDRAAEAGQQAAVDPKPDLD